MIQAEHGLSAVVKAAQAFQIIIAEEALEHAMGIDCYKLSPMDVCRAAKEAGMRSKWVEVVTDKLHTLPVPALLCFDGQWSVIEKVEKDHWVRYDITTQRSVEEAFPSKETCPKMLIILLAEKDIEIGDTKFGLHWFLPSILRHSKQLRDVLYLSLMLQLLILFSPFFFQSIVDMVLVGRGMSSLRVLALGMMSLAFAEPICSYIRNKTFSHLSSRVNSELSSRLYRHLVSLPLNYFSQRQTGQIVARIREMNYIRQFLTGSGLILILDSIFVLLFLSVMFYYSYVLAWIVIGSLILFALFWLVMGPILRYRVTKEYNANATSTAYLTEMITGIETIKTTSTEPDALYRWQRILSSQLRASFRATKTGIIAGQGIALVQKLASTVILWCGVKIVLQGHLTPGGLVAFNMLAGYVTQPILRLSQLWQDFQHTLIALRRIGDILDTPSEIGSKGIALVPQLQGKIEFKNVRFRYVPEAADALQDLSFVIKAGEFVGITGPSGSGKSTLTRLMQRLYVPQYGRVMVDGMDLAVADPISLRRNMSIVLQENILFAGSITENISLCGCDVKMEDVVQAAQLAGADEFIRALPNGYNTYLGEKGNGLSGGQRQRIALARSLLANPRILILDEATSALDYESESAIMSNMDLICHKRTVISIAHRLNTIRRADRILVIDRGTVCEQGTHDELLELKGLYYHLWQQQTC